MKKSVALLLVFVMLFSLSLTGCSDENESAIEDNQAPVDTVTDAVSEESASVSEGEESALETNSENQIEVEHEKLLWFGVADEALEEKYGFAMPRTGFMKQDGTVVIQPADYYGIYNFKNGYAVLMSTTNNKFGVINEDGEWIIEPKYDYLSEIQDDIMVFELEGEQGYLTIDGEKLFDETYSSVTPFVGEYAIVIPDTYDHTKDCIVNKNGEIVLENEYTMHFIDEETGLIAIEDTNGKQGFINMDGEIMVEPIYDGVSPIKRGYFIARNGETRTLMSLEGEAVWHKDLEFKYSEAGYYIFQEGGMDENTSNKFIFDSKGNLVYDENFKYIEYTDIGFILTSFDDGTTPSKSQLYDIETHQLTDIPEEAKGYMGDGYFLFKAEPLRGLIDLEGNKILPKLDDIN